MRVIKHFLAAKWNNGICCPVIHRLPCKILEKEVTGVCIEEKEEEKKEAVAVGRCLKETYSNERNSRRHRTQPRMCSIFQYLLLYNV